MEDVSDPPFRALCKEQGADLMYTEFISSEGLIRDAAKSIQKLDIFEYERPIGIQIFGNDIESMMQATELTEAAQPNIIDINYGCPVKKVACKGAGAGILQDIPKMVRMTEAIVKSTKLPVTVKTRLGWDENTKYIVEVAERLQDVGIQGISIHGRTRAQMYTGEADWSLIADVKNNPRMKIPIIGNGDVNSPQVCKQRFEETGVDAVMIGRASFGAPWIFREVKHYLETGQILPKEPFQWYMDVLKEQVTQSVERIDERRGILHIRRHLANSPLFKGIPDFKSTRIAMLRASTVAELFEIMDNI